MEDRTNRLGKVNPNCIIDYYFTKKVQAMSVFHTFPVTYTGKYYMSSLFFLKEKHKKYNDVSRLNRHLLDYILNNLAKTQFW